MNNSLNNGLYPFQKRHLNGFNSKLFNKINILNIYRDTYLYDYYINLYGSIACKVTTVITVILQYNRSESKSRNTTYIHIFS